MKKLFLIATILTLSACATPVTVLKNDKTGDVVTCGGGTSGSLAGGLIGYNIQKGNDEKCVEVKKAEGYTAYEVMQ